MRSKYAFTLVEVMIVVAIIAMLAAVGAPSFLNSPEGAETNMKGVNVSTINAAKDQWAILNNQPADTSVAWNDIKDYVGGGITEQSDLDIGGCSISLNNVGTTAAYPDS